MDKTLPQEWCGDLCVHCRRPNATQIAFDAGRCGFEGDLCWAKWDVDGAGECDDVSNRFGKEKTS